MSFISRLCFLEDLVFFSDDNIRKFTRKPFVICIMTHGESWRPTGESPQRGRVNTNFLFRHMLMENAYLRMTSLTYFPANTR